MKKSLDCYLYSEQVSGYCSMTAVGDVFRIVTALLNCPAQGEIPEYYRYEGSSLESIVGSFRKTILQLISQRDELSFHFLSDPPIIVFEGKSLSIAVQHAKERLLSLLVQLVAFIKEIIEAQGELIVELTSRTPPRVFVQIQELVKPPTPKKTL
jgi:hypothetical protein